MDILVSGLMVYDWTMDFPGGFSDQLLATQKPRGPASLIPPAPSAGCYAPVGRTVTRSQSIPMLVIRYPLSTIPCLFPFALRGLLNSQDRLLACIPYHQE